MAAEREYKQRCDNPAILSAMKAPSCEMKAHRGHMHLFRECSSWSEPVPSHPGTNTTGSTINNSQRNIRPSWLFGCYSEWFTSFASLSCRNPTFVCVKMSRAASVLFEISANSCSSMLFSIRGGYTRWSGKSEPNMISARGLNPSIVHKLPLAALLMCLIGDDWWQLVRGGGGGGVCATQHFSPSHTSNTGSRWRENTRGGEGGMGY